MHIEFYRGTALFAAYDDCLTHINMQGMVGERHWRGRKGSTRARAATRGRSWSMQVCMCVCDVEVSLKKNSCHIYIKLRATQVKTPHARVI